VTRVLPPWAESPSGGASRLRLWRDLHPDWHVAAVGAGLAAWPVIAGSAGVLVSYGEDRPLIGNAGQLVGAAVGERDAGSGDQVFDGPGCEHPARAGT